LSVWYPCIALYENAFVGFILINKVGNGIALYANAFVGFILTNTVGNGIAMYANAFMGFIITNKFENDTGCVVHVHFRYLEEVKGLSDEDLGQYVWPFYIYGSALALIPLGLATEVWGYRRIILFGLICREATRIVLIYGEGVTWMAIMQVTFAAACGVDTIFFAYVYMVVDSIHFKSIGALTQASYHVGNIIGSAMGQVCFSTLTL
jgi:MFS family permease